MRKIEYKDLGKEIARQIREVGYDKYLSEYTEDWFDDILCAEDNGIPIGDEGLYFNHTEIKLDKRLYYIEFYVKYHEDSKGMTEEDYYVE